MTGFLSLPEEVLVHLFEYVTMEDLCSLSRVCRALHQVADDDSLWRPFCGPALKAQQGADPRYKQVYLWWLRESINRYRRGWSPSFVRRDDGSLMMKLLILGDSGVGKSSLLTRWADDTFSSSFCTTIGIDFKIKTIELEGETYKIQIWDTAGQERFKTITVAYYRGVHGTLLVYDTTDEESVDHLSYWLGQIEQNSSPFLPIVLAGNKTDHSSVDPVLCQKGTEFAEENGMTHVLTSAKTGSGVNLAFTTLIEQVVHKKASGICLKSLKGQPTPSYMPSPEILERHGIRFGDRRPADPPTKKGPDITPQPDTNAHSCSWC